MKKSVSALKNFVHRGYKVTIMADKIIFEQFIAEGREKNDDVNDLLIKTEPSSIVWSEKIAKDIINRFCWRFVSEIKGTKILIRYSGQEGHHGWCWKTDKNGLVTKNGVFLSEVAAINDAVSSIS